MITTDPRFEGFVAKLYVDAGFRKAFLEDPEGEALRAGLSKEQALELSRIDRPGLLLAARSFQAKRNRMSH